MLHENKRLTADNIDVRQEFQLSWTFELCSTRAKTEHRESQSHKAKPFYRAMLCIRGTSHGPVSVRPSVCLSVTSRSSTKTAKRRITQTTPHDSPGILVF